VDDDGSQTSAGGISVAQLLAVLGCRDRQHSIDEASAEALEQSFPLQRREDGRTGHIPHEFRSGVGGVHTLPAGTGRPRESPRQLGLGDRDSRVDPKTWTVSCGHATIILLAERNRIGHTLWLSPTEGSAVSIHNEHSTQKHVPGPGESSIPELEDDENIAPRPEEEIADVLRAKPDVADHSHHFEDTGPSTETR